MVGAGFKSYTAHSKVLDRNFSTVLLSGQQDHPWQSKHVIHSLVQQAFIEPLADRSCTQRSHLQEAYSSICETDKSTMIVQRKQALREVCKCMLSQSCWTLCDPMDCSPPGSSVHGILQARILEWVAMPFSRGSSQPTDWTHVFHVSCIGRWVLYHWATREVHKRGRYPSN